MSTRFLPAAFLFTAVLGLLIFANGPAPTTHASHAGGMDAMLIDMAPSVSAPNTGTSFDTIEACARVNENDTLDADEVSTDTLQVDVVADNIPSSNPAIATHFILHFPAGELSVTQVATPFATANGWNILNAGDTAEQTDGDFTHLIADLNSVGNHGSGAISRLTLVSAMGASSGLFALTLEAPASVDQASEVRAADNTDPDTNYAIQDPPAFVAVDTACPEVNISVDTDPGASPANTADAVGTIESCSVILNDDVLNADEDSIDSIAIDVVVEPPGIIPYDDGGTPDPSDDRWGIVGYGLSLNFDPAIVEIASADPEMFLGSAAGSNLVVADNGGASPGQTFPNATGISSPAVADQGPIPGSLESGDGVLVRYALEGVAAGVEVAVLTLTNSGIIDVANTLYPADSTSPGYVVLNELGGCTSDLDSDGVPGIADNCPTTPNAGQQNTDGDLFGDACDNCPDTPNDAQTDGDSDGVGTACDNCPSTPNAAQTDGDSDSVGNACDNCPSTSNAAQEDGDGDAVGDACDNCPSTSNAAQTNSDSDTFGDACDNCPSLTNQAQTDNDSDGLGDVCDSDDDDDGVLDSDETACGSDSLNAASRPERTDDLFAGVDDDGDTQIDEPITGASGADCDGDGFTAADEDYIFSPTTQSDQDACGSSPRGWPADLATGGTPIDSTNKINVLDITSFLVPVRYFGTDVGTNPGDQRWDLVPGKGIFLTDVNIQDLTRLITLVPPMLDGARAFGGPDCPWNP